MNRTGWLSQLKAVNSNFRACMDNARILIAALVMDAAVLGALLITKGASDPLELTCQ